MCSTILITPTPTSEVATAKVEEKTKPKTPVITPVSRNTNSNIANTTPLLASKPTEKEFFRLIYNKSKTITIAPQGEELRESLNFLIWHSQSSDTPTSTPNLTKLPVVVLKMVLEVARKEESYKEVLNLSIGLNKVWFLLSEIKDGAVPVGLSLPVVP